MNLEAVSLKEFYQPVNDAWPGEWDKSQAADIALSRHYEEHTVIFAVWEGEYVIICQWVESPWKFPDERFRGMSVPELCQKMKQFIDDREMPPYEVLI